MLMMALELITPLEKPQTAHFWLSATSHMPVLKSSALAFKGPILCTLSILSNDNVLSTNSAEILLLLAPRFKNCALKHTGLKIGPL